MELDINGQKYNVVLSLGCQDTPCQNKDSSELKELNFNEYKLTDSYKILEEELNNQMSIGNLSEDQKETTILFAAYEYERYVNNEKNAWNIIKDCLVQIPVALSVIDIIQSKCSLQKYFYVVYENDKEETLEIFRRFNIEPSINNVFSNKVNQICFIFVEKFSTTDLYKDRENHIGYKIFHELERHMIELDYFFYSWDREKDMFSNHYDNKIHINTSYWLFGMRGKHKNDDNRNSQHGYRKDLDCAFRSSWEANIARILNYKNNKWEYEIKQFPLGDVKAGGAYLPDFFINGDAIIEVKGFWDALSRNRALCFTKLYPNYKYFIIDGDMYFSLKDKYSSLIPEWEENDTGKLKEETLQIVGLNFGVRKQTFKTLKTGDQVIFKRDPQNTYDINAILALTDGNKEIGFISGDWAVIYAPKLDLGMTFDAEIASIEPKVINIKVKRNNPETEILYDFLK